MPTATVTSKGQITIPKKVREALHLQTGDRVAFEVLNESEAAMKAASTSVDDVFGRLHDPARPALSVGDMNKAVAEALRRGRKT